MSDLDLLQALFKARKEFTPIAFNKMGWAKGSQYPYADLKAIYDAVLPSLEKHGILLCQNLISGEDGIWIVNKLIHVDTGQEMTTHIKVPDQGTNSQAWGSAITYFKRYSLASMFCLHAQEDDDGASSTISSSSAEEEKALRKTLMEIFMQHPDFEGMLMKNKSLTELTITELKAAIQWCHQRIKS